MTPDDCAPLLHCTADSLHIFIPINRLRNNAVSPGAGPHQAPCTVMYVERWRINRTRQKYRDLASSISHISPSTIYIQ